jgi:divalent metal cation (Fe/Co/Zn/Cd) transporter
VDVTISVPRSANFEQVHAISDAVERRVGEIVPSDVVVHMEPRAHRGEHLFDGIRAIAQRRGLSIHELSAHPMGGRLFIEMHLEVSEKLSLQEAHRLATLLEEEIRQLPAVGDGSESAVVNIHIEQLGTFVSGAEHASAEMRELGSRVEAFVNGLAGRVKALFDCHEVNVRQVERKILVSCHCTMDGSMPITAIHDATAVLEDRVKEKFPEIARVTIHPEPREE